MEDCRELSEWRRGQCDTMCTGIRCYLIALSESGEEQQLVVINARNKPYHSNTRIFILFAEYSYFYK